MGIALEFKHFYFLNLSSGQNARGGVHVGEDHMEGLQWK